MMDLDHFKRANDDYRHEAGNFVLREIATRILTHMREVDTLARRGARNSAC